MLVYFDATAISRLLLMQYYNSYKLGDYLIEKSRNQSQDPILADLQQSGKDLI